MNVVSVHTTLFPTIARSAAVVQVVPVRIMSNTVWPVAKRRFGWNRPLSRRERLSDFLGKSVQDTVNKSQFTGSTKVPSGYVMRHGNDAGSPEYTTGTRATGSGIT